MKSQIHEYLKERSKRMGKKAYFFFVFVLFACAAGKAQTPGTKADTTQSPEITFETIVIDYGTIEQSSDGSRVFKFKNTGKQPLILSNVIGSCQCTVPTYSKEPINPGQTGEIKVQYNTKNVGAFEKTVTVTSNAING